MSLAGSADLLANVTRRAATRGLEQDNHQQILAATNDPLHYPSRLPGRVPILRGVTRVLAASGGSGGTLYSARFGHCRLLARCRDVLGTGPEPVPRARGPALPGAGHQDFTTQSSEWLSSRPGS